MSKPVMITLPEDTPPSSKLIQYCVNAYAEDFGRMAALRKYYLNENDILDRWFDDATLPNNKIAHCFPKYISNIATAYFMGKGVKYETDDSNYKERLDEILEGNYTDSHNFEEAKEMSIAGVSYELLYIDTDGNLKTTFLKAFEVIPVFAGQTGRFLSMAIRIYAENDLDGNASSYADVYTKTEIITYHGMAGGWQETKRRVHLFEDVPIIIRRNNSERKSDFEDVITLVDAYDRSQSDTMNDMDYFTDAYLMLSGAEDIVTEESKDDGSMIQNSTKCMKQGRMLIFPDGNGKAEWLIKAINDTATENFKSRIYKDIFFLSQVPNLTDENFSGNLTGVAQKYKLFGIEGLCTEKEKYWKSAERKKLKLITQYINTRYLKAFDWRTIKVSFDRSQIANTLEISEIMNNLRDILPQKTIIGMWPDVEDAQAELDQLQEEKQAELSDGTKPNEVY